MDRETIIYLTNIIICAIIAVLMTDAWRRGEHRGSLLYWMIAAWVMLVADILFASRPILPGAVDRILPTLLVTVGQAILLVGARIHAEMTVPRRLTAILVMVHAVALVAFYFADSDSVWRRVVNGIIWATLAFLSYRALRNSAPVFWRSYTAPATVFAAHAVFHLFRISFASFPAAQGNGSLAVAVDIMGDLEVSFFMVALFVGLLISNLQQRNEQLSQALAEVKTLSGLLPICAWCKKVRDDDGYWQQVDEYFRTRSEIRFSHGMCADCADDFKKDTAEI
ncbi:hypothetical protein [Synoicihabitans lomoniglobus]|uniref:Uncharacterized protein n=1 Tax=Synoicihabitans lomoniglobus TaxID=2909285 RepID=A0AAF0CRK4_9BACT|nr:hypothetical protein [Opitutaceae bacterium LMO-M01]WED66742.1 hypothetical protein PXH66_07755 [Opitutaceae bacterium LMO-M01]